MNFSQAIHFSECCRDIFNVFFDTRRISRHFRRIFRPERSKGKKIHRKCQEICRVLIKIVENVETSRGKVNCQANFH